MKCEKARPGVILTPGRALLFISQCPAQLFRFFFAGCFTDFASMNAEPV